MRVQYSFLVGLLSLLLGAGIAGAQNPQGFAANIVKIADSKGTNGAQVRYGFITGASSDASREIYFVVISSDRQFLEKRPKLNVVLYNYSKEKSEQATAEQLNQQDYPSVGDYYLALYQVASKFDIQTAHYQALNPAELENYHLFWDTAEEENVLKPYYAEKGKYEINQVNGQSKADVRRLPAKFAVEAVGLGPLALAGMPLVNNINNVGSLVGIIAENQQERVRTFDVLNILTIKSKLSALGQAKASDACKYFSLLEYAHERTDCGEARFQEDLARKSEQERREIIAHLNKEQKRVIQKDKNYPFALSASVGGFGSYMAMNTAQGSKDAGGAGFSGGLNLHLAPDSSAAHFTFKPRYAQYEFTPPTSYGFTGSTSGFALKRFKVTTVEMPIMLEFVTSRKKKGNDYFGLGYAPGMQQAADFTFTTTANQTERREKIISNPRFTHKLVAELGYESGKTRIALSYSYQLRQFLRHDYAFIVDGESITPLRDTGHGYGSFGLELAYRLWGRWQNGRIYKK